MNLKSILFLSFLMITTLSFSQNSNFPIQGKFKVKETNPKVQRDFNTIEVVGDIFHLKHDDLILQTYKVQSASGTTFMVEEYYTDNVKRDLRKMNIEIVEHTANTCTAIIKKAYKQEVLSLVRK